MSIGPLDYADLRRRLDAGQAMAVFFGTPDCRACHALLPKLEAMLQESFPIIELLYVDCTKFPDIASQFGVFSVPLLMVYFDGREWLRKGRNFSLAELHRELERPYTLQFGR